jgi:hypothetical protein
MDRPDNGTRHPSDDLPPGQELPTDGLFQPDEQNAANFEQAEDAEEVLGNDLASYAFLREDDDREVRLYFRDAPVGELALAFRKAGGLLLSIAGERAPVVPPPAPPIDLQAQVEGKAGAQGHRRRRHKSSDPEDDQGHEPARSRHMGELTLRYFFALEDIVYTLILTSSTGVVESIASIYPQAALSEQEVRSRLAAIFKQA